MPYVTPAWVLELIYGLDAAQAHRRHEPRICSIRFLTAPTSADRMAALGPRANLDMQVRADGLCFSVRLLRASYV